MHFRDLNDSLLKHTDIRGFEVEVFLEPNGVKTYAKIGMPKSMVGHMETFVREYWIDGAEWQTMGLADAGPWYRLRFPITV
jgi:hypothetical protein